MKLQCLCWAGMSWLALGVTSRWMMAADSETRVVTDSSTRPMAALLSLDDSALGPLLEQQLLADPRAVWLERSAIQAIQREQQFQTLLGAAAALNECGSANYSKPIYSSS